MSKYECFADKGPLPITVLPCAKIAHKWDVEDDVRCAKAIYGAAKSAAARLQQQLDNAEFIKQYTRYSKTFARNLSGVISKLEAI